MTTIVYANGVMAADRQLTSNGRRGLEVTKIFRNEAGDLAGVCGNATSITKLQAWFLDGEAEKLEIDEDSEVLVVRVDGTFEIHVEDGWFASHGEYIAQGSGCEFAMGALAAGANVIEALRAAAKHDVHTGSAFNVLGHTDELANALISEVSESDLEAQHGLSEAKH